MKKTPTVDYSARHDSFERWFQTPLGRSLLASQRAVLDHELGAMAGARQLQVGVSHRLPLATSTDFAQKIITTPAWHPNMPDGAAVCDADELPFPGDSMDLVVLHHTADFSPYPHQVLREAARVLRGEGVIALIGFNPFSLWGVRAPKIYLGGKLPFQMPHEGVERDGKCSAGQERVGQPGGVGSTFLSA